MEIVGIGTTKNLDMAMEILCVWWRTMENPLVIFLSLAMGWICQALLKGGMVVPRGDKNWGNIVDEVEDMSQQVGSA